MRVLECEQCHARHGSTPDKPSFAVAAAPRALEVACTYLVLGIEHILLGVDHLLFVLVLLILVRGWRRLLGTITAFTVAHSLTPAAATLTTELASAFQDAGALRGEP